MASSYGKKKGVSRKIGKAPVPNIWLCRSVSVFSCHSFEPVDNLLSHAVIVGDFCGGVLMNTRTGFSVLGFFALLLAAEAGRAGEAKKAVSPKIVVQASATVNVKPDAAKLSFVISTEKLTKAREENQKLAKKIKDSLTALSFPNVDIQVVPVALDTIDSQPGAGAPGVKSKKAHTNFFVTVHERDTEKLKEMVTKLADVAVENGATALQADDLFPLPRGLGLPETMRGPRIEWLAIKNHQAKQAALKMALEDALIQAQAVAGKAKLQVIEIQVSGGNELRLPLRSRLGDVSSLPKVTVHVQVTYSY